MLWRQKYQRWVGELPLLLYQYCGVWHHLLMVAVICARECCFCYVVLCGLVNTCRQRVCSILLHTNLRPDGITRLWCILNEKFVLVYCYKTRILRLYTNPLSNAWYSSDLESVIYIHTYVHSSSVSPLPNRYHDCITVHVLEYKCWLFK